MQKLKRLLKSRFIHLTTDLNINFTDDSSSCAGMANCRQLSSLYYLISAGSFSPTSWSDASRICQGMRGELASVESATLQLALLYYLTGVYGGAARKVWVGAYKGGWTWLAGQLNFIISFIIVLLQYCTIIILR